jgi:hypothetical protein
MNLKIILFSFGLLLGTAAIAQTESGNRTQLGKHYWGVGSGYYGATRNISSNGVTTFSQPITLEKEFVYGRRLVKSLYLEIGLHYSHRRANNAISGNPTSSNTNTYYSLNTETTQLLFIPIAIRYRSSGSTLRFITGATLGGIGVGGIRTNQKDYNREGQLLQEKSRIFRGLAYGPGFGMNAGIEYQANPNWMFRAETHLGVSGGGSLGGADFMPGLSFGIYRSLGN